MRGVSVSASVACVPIASAKVRRFTALHKKTHEKSGCFCKKRPLFSIPTLQTIRKAAVFGDFRGIFRPSRSLSEEKRRVLRVQRTAEGPEKEANEGGYSIYINRNAKLALPDFSVFFRGKIVSQTGHVARCALSSACIGWTKKSGIQTKQPNRTRFKTMRWKASFHFP